MLREELRAAVNEKDYTSAVAKAEKMATYYEGTGDQDKAKKAWMDAAKLFLEWSQTLRDGKTHKNSAKALVHAADIFTKLGIENEAAQAISLAAQDLVFAGDEYIVWKQPVGASVCYATSSILFILVSQDEQAQQVVEQVRTRIDALRHDSTANAIVDLPIQLILAKDQLDIRLMNNVKTLIYTSLVPALTNSGLSEFTAYVERTVLGVENFINASQKYPVLNYELKMEGEVTIDNGFDIEVLITNVGEDIAHDVELEMVPKKEVTIVREFSKLKVPQIPPNSAAALTWRCIVKSQDVLEETQKLNLSARLAFSDPKNMRQTISISPIAFTTVSPKEQDQLRVDLKAIKDNIQKTKEKLLAVPVDSSELVIVKIFEIFNQIYEQTEGFVDAGAVQNAKTWAKLLQLQLELMKDIPNQIPSKKDE